MSRSSAGNDRRKGICSRGNSIRGKKHTKFTVARDKVEGVSRIQITSLDFTVMTTGSH